MAGAAHVFVRRRRRYLQLGPSSPTFRDGLVQGEPFTLTRPSRIQDAAERPGSSEPSSGQGLVQPLAHWPVSPVGREPGKVD